MDVDSTSATDEQSSSSQPIELAIKLCEVHEQSSSSQPIELAIKLCEVSNGASMVPLQVPASRGGHAMFVPPRQVEALHPLSVLEGIGQGHGRARGGRGQGVGQGAGQALG